MCLQAAHRHCLTLKEPWKLQASSSSDRPRIGPGSVSRELRLGRDEGRSPHDEPRTLVMRGLWRRVHLTRTAVAPGCDYGKDNRRRVSLPPKIWWIVIRRRLRNEPNLIERCPIFITKNSARLKIVNRTLLDRGSLFLIRQFLVRLAAVAAI